MHTWLVFSLLSVLALAGSEIAQKVSLSQKVTLSAITNNFFVWTLQGTIGLVLALVFGQFTFHLPPVIVWKLLAVGCVYFAGGTFFYTSYKGNSPSISIILGTLSVVVSSILGTVFLHDTFSTPMLVGIAFILVALVVLNFNTRDKLTKYNLYAMFGGLCFGLAYTLDKSMATSISPFMYLGLMCLSVAMVSAGTSFKLINRETKQLKAKNFMPMITSALFGSAFNLFTFFAYRYGANVGIADAVNNTNIFLVIGLEIILLKDRSNLPKKVLAALTAVLGVTLIGLN